MSSKTVPVDLRRSLELITPSAISSVICVVVSLAVALGAVFINRYRSSTLSLDYQYYQAHKTVSNSHLTGTLLQNSIIRNLPLILFWALVGLIVYIVAVDAVKAGKSAVELGEELNYVHVQKKTLIRDIVVRLGIRIVVVAIWLPYILLFWHHILPYAVRLAILSTTSSSALVVAGYIVLSVIVSSLAVHVNLILLRLLMLKPRLFSSLPD